MKQELTMGNWNWSPVGNSQRQTRTNVSGLYHFMSKATAELFPVKYVQTDTSKYTNWIAYHRGGLFVTALQAEVHDQSTSKSAVWWRPTPGSQMPLFALHLRRRAGVGHLPEASLTNSDLTHETSALLNEEAKGATPSEAFTSWALAEWKHSDNSMWTLLSG